MDTSTLEADLSNAIDADGLLAVRDRAMVLKEYAADLLKRVDAAMVERIQATGQDILFGEVRFYVGTPKEIKCGDVKGLLDALLTAAGGDLDAVAACLASGAWKPGACRDVLGDAWPNHFTVTEKPKLLEGKPVKQLMSINPKFLK